MSWLADNWPMVAGFATGLVAWGKTTTDVGNNKNAIVESRNDINTLKDSMARVETHQEYTVKTLDETKKEIADNMRETRDSLDSNMREMRDSLSAILSKLRDG
jgi:septal ring factor EnvC (AmiA/AmiB activator)